MQALLACIGRRGMDSDWKAWTPATTHGKAVRVGRPLLEKLGADETSLLIEPYPKTNGHVLSFMVRFENLAWPEAVLALLSTAQSVGYGWTILGQIDEELDLITKVSVRWTAPASPF